MSSLKGDDNACIKLIKCIQKPDNLRPSVLNFYKIFFKEWLGSQTENTLSQPLKRSLVDCLNHLSKTIENTDFERKQLFADILPHVEQLLKSTRTPTKAPFTMNCSPAYHTIATFIPISVVVFSGSKRVISVGPSRHTY